MSNNVNHSHGFQSPWLNIGHGELGPVLFLMKYSFMLVKLASLMNFTGVIADDAVVARKKKGATFTVFHGDFPATTTNLKKKKKKNKKR
jgi:hypothetical protein